MTHPLLTDEAVKAGGHVVWQHTAGYPSTAQTENARLAIAAFIAHHEGERVCERCKGSGVIIPAGPGPMVNRVCERCNGTGKIAERRLITLGPEDDEKIAVAAQEAFLSVERLSGDYEQRWQIVARAVIEALTR